MAISRNTGLFGLLALTLAATWYAAGLEEADGLVVATQERGARLPGASVQPGTPAPAPTRWPAGVDAPVIAAFEGAAAPGVAAVASQQRMSPVGRDLFAVRSWQPPPAAAPPAEPVAAPRAPPLPFRYAGRMEEDGQVVAFVSEGSTTKVLRQGDTFSNYRVEEITAQGMRLVYLPLNETQRLLFESKN